VAPQWAPETSDTSLSDEDLVALHSADGGSAVMGQQRLGPREHSLHDASNVFRPHRLTGCAARGYPLEKATALAVRICAEVPGSGTRREGRSEATVSREALKASCDDSCKRLQDMRMVFDCCDSCLPRDTLQNHALIEKPVSQVDGRTVLDAKHLGGGKRPGVKLLARLPWYREHETSRGQL
jgi:hypothetical protein